MGSCRWAPRLVAAPAAPSQTLLATDIFLLTMLFSTLMLLTAVTLSASQCTFRNGGKKFDVKEGEVTSVKGDNVRGRQVDQENEGGGASATHHRLWRMLVVRQSD